jgi:WD40 repeat protein/tRNA A-37 threonylcarbamoyl transferase component Bud32
MSELTDVVEPLDPQTLLAWIDRVADRFEAAWAGGGPPSLGPFLDGTAGLRRALLLKELVKIDLEHRWRGGERRKLDDYLADWPELRGPDGWLADDLVAFAEQLRQDFGDTAASPAAETASVPGATPAPGPPAVGLRTLGKFQLGELLGKGAFGAVYKARDTELDRIVAVKVPRAGVFNSREEQERFQREARSAGQLQHPNIVAVHEVGEADGVPYIVSKYVEGRTLAEVGAEKRFPFREAAALVLRVARAVYYAHSLQVIHRDIKPSNILLDAAGQPHLTDFGLAWRGGAELTLTADGQVLGTPAYMAPEQAAGRHRNVGPHSDVYSLGVVLYQLLTGSLPFAANSPCLLQQIRHEEPPPPRRRDARIPRDLETVCLKAMAKDAARRYATADDFADDLQRFLNDEPVRAHAEGAVSRFRRWCRRNPRVAVLTGAVFLLLVTVAGIALAFAQHSLASARDRRHEALVQQLERVRLTAHHNGWSAEAWRLAAQAAALHPNPDLRTEAAATLAGLDAHPGPKLAAAPVSALAFDAQGGRLLLGGTGEESARLWDGTGEARPVADGPGEGPVAFRPDGTPLQLVLAPGAASLLLRNLDTRQTVCACPLAARPGGAAPGVRADAVGLPLLDLAPGGSWVAAGLDEPEGRGTVAVWQGESGQPLKRFAVTATALAFASNASLLAVGAEDGQVRVWSLPAGNLVAATSGRTAVHCLAFSPDARRLAVGSAGGSVTLWDWRDGGYVPCLGAMYDVTRVLFSPDGSLLVSAGRVPSLVWDAATGRRLLNLEPADHVNALAFTPDAGRLAVSAKDGVRVWDLEQGRGIRTLRGLTAPIARTRFSADGQLLAALAHNWQVAVWDVAAGRLLLVLDTPRGVYADNADFAFDPAGTRLAFCTGREARLWDLATGEPSRSWPVPPGLVDLLAYPAADRLLLFRMETRDRQHGPEESRPDQNPRVCRLRNLLEPGPGGKVLKELPDFNWHVHNAAATPDGRCFIIEGIDFGPGGKQQSVVAVDGTTGARLWHKAQPQPTSGAWLLVDPEGEFVTVATRGQSERVLLVRTATGEVVQELPAQPLALGPGARQVVRSGPARAGDLPRGQALLPRDGTEPLVVLGIDEAVTAMPVFDRSGDRLAWGNADGTVTVCRLSAIRKRLAQVGLGW